MNLTNDGATPAPRRSGRLSDGASFLIETLRVRPAARRMLSGVSVLMAVLAVALLAYPLYTNFYQDRLQSKLAIEFKKPETLRAFKAGELASGDPITKISIPAAGLKPTVVVEGTGASALRAGAGHYPNTPLPGEEGNVAIAGHRTTYGKPFANLDHLKPGDEILLETPVGKYTYRVSRDPFIVKPTDFSVISQTPGKTLTLTTCHPKGSARERLIVKAELVSETANQPAPA
ncbi:MAG TPA: class E sortase [Acidimicrobiia bacterium]|nr:class E sortase [Acidimicrobiia bacterium]